MQISRRGLLASAAGLAAAGTLWSALAAPVLAAGEPQVGVVVKIGGIPWFNAMEEGIKKAAPDYNMDAWMVGPTQADAAQQVRAIEDLIARKVAVIGIVPNDSAALAPVLGRARDAGMETQRGASSRPQLCDAPKRKTRPVAGFSCLDPVIRIQTAWTSSACRPFWPCTTLKVTAWPSCSDLKPLPWIERK